jgi:hypothetical protein
MLDETRFSPHRWDDSAQMFFSRQVERLRGATERRGVDFDSRLFLNLNIAVITRTAGECCQILWSRSYTEC